MFDGAFQSGISAMNADNSAQQDALLFWVCSPSLTLPENRSEIHRRRRTLVAISQSHPLFGRISMRTRKSWKRPDFKLAN